jgi:hypothetical protein
VDLSLTIGACLRIEGRLEFADSATLRIPKDLAGARVTLQPDTTAGIPSFVPARIPATVSADGRFVLGDFGDVLPGAYHLRVELPGTESTGWSLESATASGLDVLDAPLVLTDHSPATTTAVFRFTDLRATLSGALMMPSGRPAVDYTVLIFSVNRDWWRAPFRRVRTARPTSKGEYTFHDLPPGEYYLAALSDLAPDEWRDPLLLAEAVGAAIRVSIKQGEHKVQDLRIGGEQPLVAKSLN